MMTKLARLPAQRKASGRQEGATMNSRTDARRDSWQDEADDFDADPLAWEHAALLIESHRRQFVGEDYQAVAQDLCDRIRNPTTEDFLALSSSPDPDCGCDFCRRAEW